MRGVVSLFNWILTVLAIRLSIHRPAPWFIWFFRFFFRPASFPFGRILAGFQKSFFVLNQKVFSKLPAPNFVKIGQILEFFPYLIQRAPWLLAIALPIALAIFALIATTPLSLWGQFLFFCVTWTFALVIRKIPSRFALLLLMLLAMTTTARYIWWRSTASLSLERPMEMVFGGILYAAECYTWVILFMGFIQTAWPLNRTSTPLPDNTDLWPSVDIFIPTYNEPLSVVRPTVFAAKGIDWPADRLHIYILDDGRREAFRAFAEEVGVGYLTRSDNAHAKAGNINRALEVTTGEYVAIFDCDHIPTRCFLQATMGWFLKDTQCAMLQTPHHFFSPDPFERNLETFKQVPNEGNLFYGLIQDGNDLWNATFFCGSCAIIKRAPLLEVGGIAVETVTEDAHTALKLHRLGYNTVYLKIILAAGLATESLSGHIGQRIRWARGMAQIFRTDNPIFGKGLTLFQRLCYSNAMLHFFYGIPRLIFLTMPLMYLFFELHVINAEALMLSLYVIPHLLHASLANSAIQGEYRHSFWAEVYEAVLAWYIVLPTTIAFINPKLGKFNVTAKGGLIEESFFDWGISKPYIGLLILNLVGFGFGLMRFFSWNDFEQGTVAMNMIWTFINLITLGAAVSVATEAKQVRLAHRVQMHIPAVLYLPNGKTLHCQTSDYSTGGLGLVLPVSLNLEKGLRVYIGLNRGDREFTFPARILMNRGTQLGLKLDALSLQDEMHLVQCTFGRADAWVRWNPQQIRDTPLASLKMVIKMGVLGYGRLMEHLYQTAKRLIYRWQQ